MSIDNRFDDQSKVPGAERDAGADLRQQVSSDTPMQAWASAISAAVKPGIDAASKTMDDLKLTNFSVDVDGDGKAPEQGPREQKPQLAGGDSIAEALEAIANKGSAKRIDGAMIIKAESTLACLRDGAIRGVTADIQGLDAKDRPAYIQHLNDQLQGTGIKITFGRTADGKEDPNTVVIMRARDTAGKGALINNSGEFANFTDTDNIRISLKDGTIKADTTENDPESGRVLKTVKDLNADATAAGFSSWLKLKPDAQTAAAVFADLGVEKPSTDKLFKLLDQAYAAGDPAGGPARVSQMLEMLSAGYRQLRLQNPTGGYPKTWITAREVNQNGKQSFVIDVANQYHLDAKFEWQPKAKK